MEREERRLVDIGAWKRVRHNRFVSKCFLVPKAGLDAQGRKKHRPISKAPVTRLLYSDASEFALGGNLVEGDLSRVVPERPGLAVPGPRWHRALTLVEQQQGIFVGEIRALVENVENFLPQLRGQVVQLMEDNQAAMYATRRLVSKHPVALRLLRRL